MSEGNIPNRGSDAPSQMAPFDVWAEWMQANMGPMTATPGTSVPWLMMPGVRTGEETAELPEGAVRNDPLLSTVEKLWDANPMQSVLPIDWMEITRSLQTPGRARCPTRRAPWSGLRTSTPGVSAPR